MSFAPRSSFLLICCGLWMMFGCAPAEESTAANAAGNHPEPAVEKKAPAKKATAVKKHRANRLAKETSPYLLLHAHNPVDWYPWGPEAFAKAKKENKPVFLSIGYSSCYWCHVMERLVFENEKIAEYMNKHFVNIKVDREERPDVDDIYMTALTLYFQAIGSPQGGGWPLSMFLTPEGKPFAGGTYFPPDDGNGRVGFPTVLKRVHELWTKQENALRRNAEGLTESVRRAMRPRPVLREVKFSRELVASAVGELTETADEQYGGLDYHPGNPNPSKFPVPAKLELLQYAAEKTGDKKAAAVLSLTLDQIARGGIRDHLGGGFHRYSTDRYWHVPHFEKMLYDQAQLAVVYLQAFQQTGHELYSETAEEIFRFVLRDMTDPAGGFYSALDAETEGVEGKYYVWTPAEVDKVLGEDAALFKRVYGFNEPQRFEHGYVLHLPRPLADVAKAEDIPLPELKRKLSVLRNKLLAVRNQRKPLLKDDKILTAWNGLMIRALAEGGRILKRPEYIRAAEKAADFLLQHLRDKEGKLKRTWRNGTAKLNAYVDDYAFFISGLLALHNATGKEKWLQTARELMDDQLRDYWSKTGGGFFFTPSYHETLIARTRNAYDAVLPSGNAVNVRNLLRLAQRTGKEKYRDSARDTLQAFVALLENYPRGTAHLALALAEFLDSQPKKTSSGNAPPSEEASGEPTSSGEADSSEDVFIQLVSAEEKPPGKKRREIVTAKAYLSVDKLPVGQSCRIVLLLDIQPDWHINANPPRPKTVIPTVFSLKSPAGVKLTQLRYPAGKPLKLPGFEEPLRVYDGQVAIYGTLVVPAQVPAGLKADAMELRIRYQACTNSRCLPPKTITLKGKVPLARPGEEVRQINQKLFRRPKRKGPPPRKKE